MKQHIAAILLAVGAMTLTGCHSHKKSLPATDREGKVATVHVGRPGRQQKRIIDEANTWLGTPYRYGDQTKGVGADCSGMVMMVYQDAAGIKLPRNSAKQAEFCETLKEGDVAAGDLVFFATGKDPARVSHVGIVIDSRTFIHASSSKGVCISDMTTPYYRRTFRKFGRVPR